MTPAVGTHESIQDWQSRRIRIKSFNLVPTSTLTAFRILTGFEIAKIFWRYAVVSPFPEIRVMCVSRRVKEFIGSSVAIVEVRIPLKFTGLSINFKLVNCANQQGCVRTNHLHRS